MKALNKRGFTILELLVCVSIIMVVSSLMLSALQSARDKGRQAQCINNQRSIMQAILQYALDEEHLPDSLASMVDSDYIRRTPVSSQGYAYATSVMPYYDNFLELTKCPEVEGSIMDEEPVYSYGMSFYMTGISYHMIREPSQMLVIADCDKPYFVTSAELASRHRRGAIGGFADGHVEWVKDYQTDNDNDAGVGGGVVVEEIQIEPGDTVSIWGMVNINPANNKKFEFMLELPDGSLITHDDLKVDNDIDYTGAALTILFKPKGNGNQNSMEVDGEPYELQNKHIYTITSESMIVHLFNANDGNGMGQWWIDIDATESTIVIE